MSPADFFRQLWGGHRLAVIGIGLLLLGNVALGMALQQYLVPTVNDREQQLISRQSELRGGAFSGDSPAQLYARGEKDLVAFREKIPPYREFTGLLMELQSLAAEAGLELFQISYGRDREKDGALLRYQLSFTLEGQYKDIKQFIHLLEQSPRLIILSQVGLQGVGKDALDTGVRLQLSLETFFQGGSS
jgi:type IV pilus assembly protein PilO